MNFEDFFLQKLEELGPVSNKQMFGWQCILVSGKMLGGVKSLDDTILGLFLILDTKTYQQAIDSGIFQKFDFGKTWVETEVTSEDELQEIWPYIIASYDFVKSKVNL